MGDLLLGRNPEVTSGLVGGENQSEATLAGGSLERMRGGPVAGLGVNEGPLEGPDGGGRGVGDGPGGLSIKYFFVKSFSRNFCIFPVGIFNEKLTD